MTPKICNLDKRIVYRVIAYSKNPGKMNKLKLKEVIFFLSTGRVTSSSPEDYAKNIKILSVTPEW
jgi:hypothetical protein